MQRSNVTADPVVAAVEAVIAAGAGERLDAPYPVNTPMIRHWAQALGDSNPAYLDAEVAARTRHGGVIAPPAMLGVWTMDTPRKDGGPRDRAMAILEQAGFTSVVATDYEQDYLRQLRPGDHVAERRSIESISQRKDTALGEGYFVTVRYDYEDADGAPVGVGRMRLLKFRPQRRPAAPPTNGQAVNAAEPRPRPRPAINRDTRHFWDGLVAGQIRLQRCSACAQLRHPPGPMCPACQSTDWDTLAASGGATVVSWVTHHHPALPGIPVPHTVLLVDLDEGVRLTTHLASGHHGPVGIGDRVHLVIEEVEEGLHLPLARPARSAEAT